LIAIAHQVARLADRASARASLRLSSEQLLKLNLREGANKAVFTIISKMQGKQSVSLSLSLSLSLCCFSVRLNSSFLLLACGQVQCNIYLWNYDSKIVISDIDGTITRSDVMGHVAAFLSKDWTHTGVANLYTNIEKNGYKFVYLSSRSISHSGPTRGALRCACV
jgi:phosphatidate phosphatase LPIN